MLARRKDAFLHDVQKDNEMTSVEYSHVHKNDVAFMLIFTLSYLEIRRYGVYVEQILLLNQTSMTLQFTFSIRWVEISSNKVKFPNWSINGFYISRLKYLPPSSLLPTTPFHLSFSVRWSRREKVCECMCTQEGSLIIS